MTVVVGIRSTNGVLLAGDSQASGPNVKRMRKDAKTFQLCPTIAFAYCGSARFGQLVTDWIEDYLEEPYLPLLLDEMRWARRIFMPALIRLLEDHGHLHRYESTTVVELGDSAFLLAVRRRLFTVEPDMQVSEDFVPYAALGSGEDVAIGTLRALVGKDATEPVELDNRGLKRLATTAIDTAD